MRIAIITASGMDPSVVAEATRENAFMIKALQDQGAEAAEVAWEDEDADWSGFDAALIRTPWNYMHHACAFTAFLERIACKTHIINPPEVIAWNLDKRYLLELEAAGVAIVPTALVEDATQAGGLFDRLGAETLIFKPTVSVSGVDTHRVARAEFAGFAPVLADLMARKTVLAQPFMEEVLAEGEISLITIAGAVTHAVRKTPPRGGFLVQEEHGGQTVDYAPTRADRTFAAQVLGAARGPLAYARVDAVRGADGALRLMELEAFEPGLFLVHNPGAARELARAVLRAI